MIEIKAAVTGSLGQGPNARRLRAVAIANAMTMMTFASHPDDGHGQPHVNRYRQTPTELGEDYRNLLPTNR